MPSGLTLRLPRADEENEFLRAHRATSPETPSFLLGYEEGTSLARYLEMLADWEKRFPGRIETMFRSLANVVPSHLMDRKLYPFQTIQARSVADPAGDKAFDDDDPCATPPAVAPIQFVPAPVPAEDEA